MTVQKVRESIENQTKPKQKTTENDVSSLFKLFGNMALINEVFATYCDDILDYVKE